jgi:hypothetical protein
MVKKQIDSKMVLMIKLILQWQKTVDCLSNSCFTNIEWKIKTPGVQLHYKEVYLPILKELEEYGVV